MNYKIYEVLNINGLINKRCWKRMEQTKHKAITAKPRDNTIDALKLFAIFMVLWGHSIQHLQSAVYYSHPVYQIIYSFHMPLFMALVGYFAFPLLKQPFIPVLKKKIRQLLIPALTFGLLLSIIEIYVLSDGIGLSAIANAVIHRLCHSLWFLKSSFICIMLFYVTFRLCRNENVGTIVSLIISQFLLCVNVYSLYPAFLYGGGYYGVKKI